MIVISDSNIIFSCFYAPNGVIANILCNKKNPIQFIAPDYLLEEVEEHLPEIMGKVNMTKKEALTFLKEVTKNITFYKLEQIPSKYTSQAKKIVRNIDIDDYPFVALHFQEGHKIWTCDFKLINGLKEEGLDICITTSELKSKTYKKN